VVMAPHLVWLVKNDFLPFAYASARAVPSRGPIDHVWHPLLFTASQFATMLPALAIALPLAWPRSQARAAVLDDFDRRIVTLLTFGPFVATIAISLITSRGLVVMWGYPLWLFLGLWIVMAVRPVIDRLRLTRVVSVWAIVFSALALAFVVNYTV